jgi:hypothetical protein
VFLQRGGCGAGGGQQAGRRESPELGIEVDGAPHPGVRELAVSTRICARLAWSSGAVVDGGTASRIAFGELGIGSCQEWRLDAKAISR